MLPSPSHGSGIPAHETHATNSDMDSNGDLAQCDNCGMNWVPQARSLMSSAKLHTTCQRCTFSDVTYLKSHENTTQDLDKADGIYAVISDNPTDVYIESDKEGTRKADTTCRCPGDC